MVVSTLELEPAVAPLTRQSTPDAGSGYNPVSRSAQVSVAVLADDPLTGQGAVACLRGQAGLQVLPTARRREAEVILILVQQVTDETLLWMQSEAASSSHRNLKFVLVGDGIREHHIMRAVAHGLVGVIPRREADYSRIAEVIHSARAGHPQIPEAALGWLIKQIREIHLDVLTPNGLTATGLETREADVLRLLAEGLDTAEIAEELKYSERTVKNIIHGLLTRFDLRNRAHAVSFALRRNLL
jgi:DNA-binding NarL/FixJ family response regulator